MFAPVNFTSNSLVNLATNFVLVVIGYEFISLTKTSSTYQPIKELVSVSAGFETFAEVPFATICALYTALLTSKSATACVSVSSEAIKLS